MTNKYIILQFGPEVLAASGGAGDDKAACTVVTAPYSNVDHSQHWFISGDYIINRKADKALCCARAPDSSSSSNTIILTPQTHVPAQQKWCVADGFVVCREGTENTSLYVCIKADGVVVGTAGSPVTIELVQETISSIAHWQFNGTGAVVKDISGSGFHGELHNAAFSVQENGTDLSRSVFIVPSSPALDMHKKFTVEAWVWLNSVNEKEFQNPILSKPGAGSGWELRYDKNGPELTMTTQKNVHISVYSTPTSPLHTEGQWVHIAATHDAEKNTELWVNAERVGSERLDIVAQGGYVHNDQPLYIGQCPGFPDRQFNGFVREARICHSVLTPDQFFYYTVNFKNHSFSVMPQFLTSMMHIVRVIDLACGRLESFNDTNQPFPNLEHLDLHDNHLQVISITSTTYPKLEYLDITGNCFIAFPSVPNIKTLKLMKTWDLVAFTHWLDSMSFAEQKRKELDVLFHRSSPSQQDSSAENLDTMLEETASYGTVQDLVDQSKDKNIQGKCFLLHAALRSPHHVTEKLVYLLSKGVRDSQKLREVSALMQAVTCATVPLEAISLLLHAGSFGYITDSMDRTALYLLCESHLADVDKRAKLLLDSFPDLCRRSTKMPARTTVVMVACQNEDHGLALLQLLMKLSPKPDLQSCDTMGNTAHYYAATAKKQPVEKSELLLQEGGVVNGITKPLLLWVAEEASFEVFNFYFPLNLGNKEEVICALFGSVKSQHDPLRKVQLLLERANLTNEQKKSKDSENHTVMFHAAHSTHEDAPKLLKLFFTIFFPPKLKPADDLVFLEIMLEAVQSFPIQKSHCIPNMILHALSPKAEQLLSEIFTNWLCTVTKLESPVEYVNEEDYQQLFQFFVNKAKVPADPRYLKGKHTHKQVDFLLGLWGNPDTNTCGTAIDIASAMKYHDYSKLPDLLSTHNSAAVVAVDLNGNSLLHFAVFLKNKPLVKEMLDHNFDCTIKNKYGLTALHCAQAQKLLDITPMLEDYAMLNISCDLSYNLAIEKKTATIKTVKTKLMEMGFSTMPSLYITSPTESLEDTSLVSTVAEERPAATTKILINRSTLSIGGSTLLGSRYLIKGPFKKEGGNNEIARAYDIDKKERVVIKKIHVISELHNEAKVLHALLGCAHVVRYKEQYKNYVVMERGAYDLRQFIDRNKMFISESDIKNIAYHIICALCEVHEKNYVHLDVKPANIIFVITEGKWKLIDFDSAHEIGGQIPSHYKGTELYRSPELEHHNAKQFLRANPAMDVWAFGLILAELYTRTPIKQTPHWEKSILQQLKNVSEQAAAVVEYALKIDPKDRATAVKLRDNAYFKGGLNTKQQQSSLDGLKDTVMQRLDILQNLVRQLPQAVASFNTNIPYLFVLVPKKNPKETKTRFESLKSLFRDKLKLHFICQAKIGFHFIPNHPGITVRTATKFMKSAAPIIKISLTLLKYACAIGKLAGVPSGLANVAEGLSDVCLVEHLISFIDSMVDLPPGDHAVTQEHFKVLQEILLRKKEKSHKLQMREINGEFLYLCEEHLKDGNAIDHQSFTAQQHTNSSVSGQAPLQISSHAPQVSPRGGVGEAAKGARAVSPRGEAPNTKEKSTKGPQLGSGVVVPHLPLNSGKLSENDQRSPDIIVNVTPVNQAENNIRSPDVTVTVTPPVNQGANFGAAPVSHISSQEYTALSEQIAQLKKENKSLQDDMKLVLSLLQNNPKASPKDSKKKK